MESCGKAGLLHLRSLVNRALMVEYNMFSASTGKTFLFTHSY